MRKRHLGEGVEQLGVLDQRGALVEQILPLVDAVLIDAAIDADHQVERQAELAAMLGEQPEDAVPAGASVRLSECLLELPSH